MIWIARIGVGLIFLFSLAMGLLAMFAPEQAAEALGFGTLPEMGLNSMRADLGGLFLTGAIMCGGALFAGKPKWLYVPLLVFGLALIGRLIGVAMAGAPEGIAEPIIIEAVMVAILGVSARIMNRAV